MNQINKIAFIIFCSVAAPTTTRPLTFQQIGIAASVGVCGSIWGSIVTQDAEYQYKHTIPLALKIQYGTPHEAHYALYALKQEILREHHAYCSTWRAWINPPADRLYPFLRYVDWLDFYINSLYVSRFFNALSANTDHVKQLQYALLTLRMVIRQQYEYIEELRAFNHEQALQNIEQRIEEALDQ